MHLHRSNVGVCIFYSGIEKDTLTYNSIGITSVCVGGGCVADIASERRARRGANAFGSGRRVVSMLAMSIREHVKRQATEAFSRNSTDGIFVSLASSYSHLPSIRARCSCRTVLCDALYDSNRYSGGSVGFPGILATDPCCFSLETVKMMLYGELSHLPSYSQR